MIELNSREVGLASEDMTPSYRDDPILAPALAYWLSKRGSLPMPRKLDIDPTEIPPRVLPHLQIVEVIDDGARFRYRLIGTALVQNYGIFFLPNDREETQRRDLDLVGFALLSPGLVLFLYGSEHMGELIGQITVALSVVLLAMFITLAIRKGDRALIDLQLFKGKTFAAATVAQFMSNGILFAGQMLIPIYLIRACGRSPSATGWLLAPLGVGMTVLIRGWERLRSDSVFESYPPEEHF